MPSTYPIWNIILLWFSTKDDKCMKNLLVERLQIATHSVNADMCTMMSNNYGEVEIRQDQYFFEWGGSSSQPLTVGCSQSKSWTKKSLYCLLVKSQALFTPFNIRIYVFDFSISSHFYWHITVYPKYNWDLNSSDCVLPFQDIFWVYTSAGTNSVWSTIS